MQNIIIQHLSQDPVLKTLIERIPYQSPPLRPGDVYQELLSSIIGQQLSGKVAAVIRERFFGLFEKGYPHPAKVLGTEMETLRAIGLSRQKASYLQNVAAFFQREEVKDKDWENTGDEAIINYLTQIKGVGQWTVEMILMFSLGRSDILPLDDLGIRTAFVKLYDLQEQGKALKSKMKEIAAPWRPYRSYACFYLWQYKDGG